MKAKKHDASLKEIFDRIVPAKLLKSSCVRVSVYREKNSEKQIPGNLASALRSGAVVRGRLFFGTE